MSKKEPIEAQLWKAADKLRKNIDAAEYKHVVLGRVFLKYISDSFEELYAKLQAGDRKSTRLNSSHVAISYAVFCLKKKKYDRKPMSINYHGECYHQLG